MPKKILITDIDSCLLYAYPVHPKWFSPKYLEHILAAHYDAFSVCTHRHFSTYYSMVFKTCIVDQEASWDNYARYAAIKQISFEQASLIQSNGREKYILEASLNDLLLSHCVANLESEAKLTCLLVSTPDDSVGGRRCGEAYEKLHKPFDAELRQTHKITEKQVTLRLQEKTISYSTRGFFYNFSALDKYIKVAGEPSVNPHSKTRQLLDSMHAIAKQFPGEELSFDFVDDSEKILNSAINEIKPDMLPLNTSITFLHHDSFSQTPVTPLKTISNKQTIQKCLGGLSLWRSVDDNTKGLQVDPGFEHENSLKSECQQSLITNRA